MLKAGLVTAPVVEDFDVVEDRGSEERPGREPLRPVDRAELSFQGRPERLHPGVVVAVPGRAVRGGDAVGFEAVRERRGRALGALVGVVGQRSFDLLALGGHGHCVDHEVGASSWPADQLLGAGVEDAR